MKSGRGMHRDDAAAADDLGVEREDLERRLGHDRFGHGAAGRRPQVRDREPMMPSSRPLTSATASAIDAEIVARTRAIAAAYGG